MLHLPDTVVAHPTGRSTIAVGVVTAALVMLMVVVIVFVLVTATTVGMSVSIMTTSVSGWRCFDQSLFGCLRFRLCLRVRVLATAAGFWLHWGRSRVSVTISVPVIFVIVIVVKCRFNLQLVLHDFGPIDGRGSSRWASAEELQQREDGRAWFGGRLAFGTNPSPSGRHLTVECSDCEFTSRCVYLKEREACGTLNALGEVRKIGG